MDYAFSGERFSELLKDLKDRETALTEEIFHLNNAREKLQKRMRPFEMLDPENGTLALLKTEFDSIPTAADENKVQGYKAAVVELKRYLAQNKPIISLGFRYPGCYLRVLSQDFSHLEKPACGIAGLINSLDVFSSGKYEDYVKDNTLHSRISSSRVIVKRENSKGTILAPRTWNQQHRFVDEYSRLESLGVFFKESGSNNISNEYSNNENDMNAVFEYFDGLKRRSGLVISVSEIKY